MSDCTVPTSVPALLHVSVLRTGNSAFIRRSDKTPPGVVCPHPLTVAMVPTGTSVGRIAIGWMRAVYASGDDSLSNATSFSSVAGS
jgi:hypothetical protein